MILGKMSYIILVTIFALSLSTVKGSEVVETLRESATKALSQIETDEIFKEAELSKKYLVALEALEKRLAAQGDVNTISRVREEREAIEKQGRTTQHEDPPLKELRGKYLQSSQAIRAESDAARAAVAARVKQEIAGKQTALAKAGEVDAALAVLKEGDQLLAELSRMVKQPPSSNSLPSLHAPPVPIFDGKSLEGWRIEKAAYWTARNGILTGESDDKKSGSNLWTTKEYKNFTFETEFRYSGTIDSGVFLRNSDDQIQIGVSVSLKRDMTGSPYIAAARKYPVEAEGVADLLNEGKWNRIKITAIGATYQVELNGKKVVEYTSGSASEAGPIGLQIHPNLLMKIEFRNMTVSEI